MFGEVGPFAAVLAGVFSFLSPCVLPLIPAYISFITGLSLTELGSGNRVRETAGPVLLFVSGFTAVFVASGATASVLGAMLLRFDRPLTLVTGVVLAAFGVVMLGIVRVPLLASVDISRAKVFGRGTAFVLGMLFPFALGACAGPVYGAILVLASRADTVGQGALLLALYAAGLAVPFIAVGLLFGSLTAPLRALQRHAKLVNRVAGALLLATGLLMLAGRLDDVGFFLDSLLPFSFG